MHQGMLYSLIVGAVITCNLGSGQSFQVKNAEVENLRNNIPTLSRNGIDYSTRNHDIVRAELSQSNRKILGHTSHQDLPAIREENIEVDPHSGAAFPCPEEEDIAPCVCRRYLVSQIELDCSAVESDSQLADIFQRSFPVKEFRRFYIHDNENVQNFTDDIFNGAIFHVFEMNNVPNFSFLSDRALYASKQVLEGIIIYNSNMDVEAFPFDTMAEYETIFYLYLRGTRFSSIPNVESPTLQGFCIEEGSATMLPSDKFAAMPDMFYWNFYHQDITNVEAGTFHLRDGLDGGYNYIDLSFNYLNNIEPGAFVLPETLVDMQIYMFLTYNNLTVLPEDVFGEIMPYFNKFMFWGNPLECGCDVAWIVTNPDYMSRVGTHENTTCADGTIFTDLDPNYFTEMC